MSKQDKFFTKVKLFEKETKITASAILEKILITGDNGGTITSYKIIDRKLDRIAEHSIKGKIDKILIPSNRKIAFILSGGEIHVADLPKLDNFRQIIKHMMRKFSLKKIIHFYSKVNYHMIYQNLIILDK